MSDASNVARATPAAVQTATMRACEVCGAALQGAREATCSEKCRAKRWRRLQETARQERDARLGALLREALTLIENR
jgi:predicted nucleic acid-binding Zn ribbon protein